MPQAGEIRETQLENLVDGQLGESAGADRVAGGKHVDQVTIQLGQGFRLDPVRVAGNRLGTVLPIVVVLGVPKLAGFSRPNQTCRLGPSRRFCW